MKKRHFDVESMMDFMVHTGNVKQAQTVAMIAMIGDDPED